MNVPKKYQELLIHKMREEACKKFAEYASQAYRCFCIDDYVNCFKFYLLADESLSIVSEDFLISMLEADSDFADAYGGYSHLLNYDFKVVITEKEHVVNE